jgi:omega-6 fatty acid desaturase (delta-12 desaturase)
MNQMSASPALAVAELALATSQERPDAAPSDIDAASEARRWNSLLRPYRQPQLARSLFQLASTAFLFVVGCFLMLSSLELSYAVTLMLALPTAGLLIRLFIIQHDCGHGSFFSSRLANDIVGSSIGVVMLTPYHYWRKTHAIHHATHGDLGRRDLGDVMTLTVREYLALSRAGRFGYRFYRNLFVMLVLGPIYQFGIKHRFPFDAPKSWRREWASVIWTNIALAVVLLVAWRTIGLDRLALVYAPVMLIASAVGIWLFYVQHQFEDTYWTDSERWSFHRAGTEGSSFYDLPRVLHWFTGNIGYHHIHHLASQIPNYRLARCFAENPELQQVTRLELLQSFRCARLKLWDEEKRKLVGFRELGALPRAASSTGDSERSRTKLRRRSAERRRDERSASKGAA